MTAQKTIYGQRQISSSSQFYNPLNPGLAGCRGRPGGCQVVTVSTINCNYHHHHPEYCQVCHCQVRPAGPSTLSSLSLQGFCQISWCVQGILLISAPCVCSALIIVLFPDVYLWRANTCHHLPQSPRPLSKFHCTGPDIELSLKRQDLPLKNFSKLFDGLKPFNCT